MPQIPTTGRVEVLVDAERDAVWDVVRDVTRVGDWSHECVSAEWVGDIREAVPGARFRGRNRSGLVRWGRRCEVVDATPWTLTWRTVPTLVYPDSTEWTISLHDTDRGTRVEQSFRVVKMPPRLLVRLYARMIPGHLDRTEALTADLRRLGACAANASP
jgi:hypothetical protein